MLFIIFHSTYSYPLSCTYSCLPYNLFLSFIFYLFLSSIPPILILYFLLILVFHPTYFILYFLLILVIHPTYSYPLFLPILIFHPTYSYPLFFTYSYLPSNLFLSFIFYLFLSSIQSILILYFLPILILNTSNLFSYYILKYIYLSSIQPILLLHLLLILYISFLFNYFYFQ